MQKSNDRSVFSRNHTVISAINASLYRRHGAMPALEQESPLVRMEDVQHESWPPSDHW